MTFDNLKKKAVRGAGINVVFHAVSFIFNTAGVIVLARLLLPKDFGLVAMVTAFSMWVMNFGLNGFTEYIIQKKEISNGEINSIFWIHLAFATFSYACFLGFGLLLVKFYGEPDLFAISAVIGLSFILYALFTCHFAALKREMRFGYIAGSHLIAVILSVFLSISAALAGMGYWAIVARQMTLPLVAVVAAWIISPWRPGLPKYLSTALPAITYAVKVYANFSLGYVRTHLDLILIGKFHGAAGLGSYDRAKYLAAQPIGQLLTPLSNVALATLSRLAHDTKVFRDYYIRAVATISFIGLGVTAAFMLTAQDLVFLLLGPAWVETGKILMAMLPAVAANFTAGTNSWLFLSLGQPGRWLRWNIFTTICSIIALVIALPYGIFAIAVAYSIKSYIFVMPAVWYAGRPVQLGPKMVLRAIWPYFSSGVIVTAAWLFMSTYLTPFSVVLSELNIPARIALTACVSILSYICLVALFERSFKSVSGIIALIKIFFDRSHGLEQNKK